MKFPAFNKKAAAYAAVYVGWGSTYLAIRVGLEALPPFALGGMRFLLSGSVLYLWTRMRGASRPTARDWLGGGAIGFFLFLVGNGGVLWVEQTVNSGTTALLIAAVPFLMAVSEAIRPHGRRPTLRTWAGIAIGFVGVALLVRTDGSGAPPFEASIILLSSVGWVVGSLLSKELKISQSPAQAVAMQMLGGGVCLSLVGAVHGDWAVLAANGTTVRAMSAMVYLAFIGSIVSFSAYAWLLRNVPLENASTYAYVNPVVAVLLGSVFAEEVLTANTAIAGAIIVGAVAVVLRRPTRMPIIVPPAEVAKAVT